MNDNIPGFPEYHLTTEGEVFSRKKGEWKKMLPFKDRKNYTRINLLDYNNIIRNIGVHKLLLLVYVGKPSDGSLICRHLDGNPQNNNLSNLKWGTNKENSRDTRLHGRQICGERARFAKLDSETIPKIFQEFYDGLSAKDLSLKYGIHATNIKTILRRETWAHIIIDDSLIFYAKERLEKEFNENYIRRLNNDLAFEIFEFIKTRGIISFPEIKNNFPISGPSIKKILFSKVFEDLRNSLNFNPKGFPIKTKNNVMDSDVENIFNLYVNGASILSLFKTYRTDKQTIKNILLRKSRLHIPIDQAIIDLAAKLIKQNGRKKKT